MAIAPYPVLTSKGPMTLRPGTKYLLRAPQYAQANNQVLQGQTGAAVILTFRRSKTQISLDVGYGSIYVVDGNIYQTVQLQNDSSTEEIYLYEGVTLDNETQSAVFQKAGDSFNAVVAAATSKTDRTVVVAPGNTAVPLYLSYSLSAGGDIVGTAGDDWYIALVNSNNDTENIVVNRGSVAGTIKTIGGQSWNIEYLNNDTVAHRMAASFYFIVGKY